MNYDYLAWGVVVVFYLAVIMPMIGDGIAGGNNSYIESVKIGAAIHGFFFGAGAFIVSVVWAILRITT